LFSNNIAVSCSTSFLLSSAISCLKVASFLTCSERCPVIRSSKSAKSAIAIFSFTLNCIFSSSVVRSNFANSNFLSANFFSSKNCSSKISPNLIFAFSRSSGVFLMSSLICLCISASF